MCVRIKGDGCLSAPVHCVWLQTMWKVVLGKPRSAGFVAARLQYDFDKKFRSVFWGGGEIIPRSRPRRSGPGPTLDCTNNNHQVNIVQHYL